MKRKNNQSEQNDKLAQSKIERQAVELQQEKDRKLRQQKQKLLEQQQEKDRKLRQKGQHELDQVRERERKLRQKEQQKEQKKDSDGIN